MAARKKAPAKKEEAKVYFVLAKYDDPGESCDNYVGGPYTLEGAKADAEYLIGDGDYKNVRIAKLVYLVDEVAKAEFTEVEG